MNPAVRKAARWAACLCTACLILPTVAADEYSWQVSTSYRGEDAANSARTRHRSVRATYYLSPVDDATGPYELAPFLNRASYVAVGAGRMKPGAARYSIIATRPIVSNDTLTGAWSSAPGDGGVNDGVWAFPARSGIDVSQYDVGGRYVWPGSGWFAGARAQRGDSDALGQLPFFRATAEFRHTGLLAGRYFRPRTAVEILVGSETMSQVEDVGLFFDPFFGLPVPDAVPGVFPVTPSAFRIVTDEETDYAKVSVRHVGELGDSAFEFSASVRSSHTEARESVPAPVEIDTTSVSFEPPFDPHGNLIGVVGAIESGWSEREREVRLSGTLFPDESLGVRLTLSTSEHDAYGTRDRVSLSANWFFVRNAAIEIELSRSRSGRAYLRDSNAAGFGAVRLLGRF